MKKRKKIKIQIKEKIIIKTKAIISEPGMGHSGDIHGSESEI